MDEISHILGHRTGRHETHRIFLPLYPAIGQPYIYDPSFWSPSKPKATYILLRLRTEWSDRFGSSHFVSSTLRMVWASARKSLPRLAYPTAQRQQSFISPNLGLLRLLPSTETTSETTSAASPRTSIRKSRYRTVRGVVGILKKSYVIRVAGKPKPGATERLVGSLGSIFPELKKMTEEDLERMLRRMRHRELNLIG